MFYTEKALRLAYKNHILEYMQENDLEKEIGMNEEEMLKIVKQRIKTHGLATLKWVNKTKFNPIEKYFFLDSFGFIYTRNKPVTEKYDLHKIKNQFDQWLYNSQYSIYYERIA